MTTPAATVPGAPIIKLDNVIKQFGRFAALRGVTAEFESGKFYVILGENGAGKTTLMRALAGLAQPARGVSRTWIYGASVAALRRDERHGEPALLRAPL